VNIPRSTPRPYVEFIGHERLFRGTDGSYLLHMSSDRQPATEERIVWLSVRDAISWLNEEPDQYGCLWEIAQVVRVGIRYAGALRIS
jgi:hypothetical protein